MSSFVEQPGPAPAEIAPAPPAAGGCPPPLNWFDVLREFHAGADAWYLDRDGYRVSGKTWGEGPALYFLNGMGGTLELYVLSVYLLRSRFRCVLMDYAGASPGSRGRQPVTLDSLTDDLLAVARQAGDDRFNLFAASFGSLVALQALRREPDRIRRAVLQGAFAHRQLSGTERALISVARRLPISLRWVPLRRTLQQQTHRSWFPPFDPTRWQFFVDNTGQVPVRALAERAAIVDSTDLRPALPHIEQPVLIVHTEGEGSLNDACQQVLEQNLPHARTERIPIAGNLPYLTHPHRLAKVVTDFLT